MNEEILTYSLEPGKTMLQSMVEKSWQQNRFILTGVFGAILVAGKVLPAKIIAILIGLILLFGDTFISAIFKGFNNDITTVTA